MNSACRKILFCILMTMFVFSIIVNGQEQKKDKRSAFVKTVDSLIEQVDKQIQDRNKVVETLSTLSASLKKTETQNLDRRINRVRSAEIQREALFMAETLVEQDKNFTIKTELIEYLRRIVENDQKLYDEYIEQKAGIQFQLDKQLAKIRNEQTLLGTLRRDLEKLKFFPSKKEKFKFFLNSASKLLNGLDKLQPQ